MEGESVWRLTCSGCKDKGWTLDVERNMWVCRGCNRPSYIPGLNVEECDSCYVWYVVKKVPDLNYLCEKCNQ